MKYLHLFSGSQDEVVPFMKMISWNTWWEDEHILFYLEKKEFIVKKYPRLLGIRNLEFITNDFKKNIKRRIDSADVVIWHSLMNSNQHCLKMLYKDTILRKSFWLLSFREIEFFQLNRINAENFINPELLRIIRSIKALSPARLFDGVLKSFGIDLLDYECLIPVVYSKIGIFASELQQYTSNIEKEIYQIGVNGSVINDYSKLLQHFDCFDEKKRVVILRKYSDHKQERIDENGIELISGMLKENGLNVICMDGLVRKEFYLNYLEKVKSVYVYGIPATALTELAFMMSNGANLHLYNNSEYTLDSIKEYSRKLFNNQFVLNNWKNVFAGLGEKL